MQRRKWRCSCCQMWPSLKGSRCMSISCIVGAVGIELKATLKARKLLILLNEKNVKNTEFAQLRYTAGTRKFLLITRQHFRWESIPLALFEVRFLLHVDVRGLAKAHRLSWTDWHGISLDPLNKVHENLLQAFI